MRILGIETHNNGGPMAGEIPPKEIVAVIGLMLSHTLHEF
jgi:hypothetical protein